MTKQNTKQLVPLHKSERRKVEIGRDDGPSPSDIERTLYELGEMSPAEYGRRREEIAGKVGSGRTFLDIEYRERRKASKGDVRGDFLPDPDPWPDPVKGADLLDAIRDTAIEHLVLPEGGPEMIALWALFAHCHDCFDVSPLLAFTSATPECGKSTCLTLICGITPRALSASNITAAAVFRTVEKWKPTLIIDEADTFIRDNDDLRGILNSGHHRSNAFVIRSTGENHEPTRFCTWSPKIVALIGELPATLASRAIHIKLKRMLPGDRIEPLRAGRTGHLDPLLRMSARWADDHRDDLLSAADPKMPSGLYGRAADNWRPLLMIADLIGGDWALRARLIAEKISGRRAELAPVMLLEDMAGIFAEKGVTVLKSEETIEALVKMEHRPWPEWKNGKPITTRQLARLLEPFDIAPKQHWLSGAINRRGYHIEDFRDAFRRYLVGIAGIPSAMPLEPNETTISEECDPLEAIQALADKAERKIEDVQHV